MKPSTRLFKLADYCEKLGSDRFSFSEWISEDDGKCGTVCCLLGHAPGAFAKDPKWKKAWYVAYLEDKTSYVELDTDRLQRLFLEEGMTPEELHCAFIWHLQEQFWAQKGEEAENLTIESTLEEALANLRKLAEYIKSTGR